MTLFSFNGSFDTDTIESGIKEFVRGFNVSAHHDLFSFQPRCDIYGDDKSITMELELPGVSKEDVKIKYENNILTIDGEKKKASFENSDKKVLSGERRFGKFERKFTLSEVVDPSMIEAKFENGVLNIFIPKITTKPAGERNINIK